MAQHPSLRMSGRMNPSVGSMLSTSQQNRFRPCHLLRHLPHPSAPRHQARILSGQARHKVEDLARERRAFHLTVAKGHKAMLSLCGLIAETRQ